MSKEIDLPQIGKVVLTKRRASRHMRLRIGHDGTAHVSLPIWLSYRQALLFVAEKREWITTQQGSRSKANLDDGQRIGKSHTLEYRPSSTENVRTSLKGNRATVFYPNSGDITDPRVVVAAEKLAVKVLKKEAEALLPQRLRHLATQHGFQYSSVKISKMRSRWGSCNSNRLITLNCYLMQLPWYLIDYVLLHELVHTKVMSHSQKFWDEMQLVSPDVKTLRKELKTHQTALLSSVKLT